MVVVTRQARGGEGNGGGNFSTGFEQNSDPFARNNNFNTNSAPSYQPMMGDLVSPAMGGGGGGGGGNRGMLSPTFDTVDRPSTLLVSAPPAPPQNNNNQLQSTASSSLYLPPPAPPASGVIRTALWPTTLAQKTIGMPLNVSAADRVCIAAATEAMKPKQRTLSPSKAQPPPPKKEKNKKEDGTSSSDEEEDENDDDDEDSGNRIVEEDEIKVPMQVLQHRFGPQDWQKRMGHNETINRIMLVDLQLPTPSTLNEDDLRVARMITAERRNAGLEAGDGVRRSARQKYSHLIVQKDLVEKICGPEFKEDMEEIATGVKHGVKRVVSVAKELVDAYQEVRSKSQNRGRKQERPLGEVAEGRVRTAGLGGLPAETAAEAWMFQEHQRILLERKKKEEEEMLKSKHSSSSAATTATRFTAQKLESALSSAASAISSTVARSIQSVKSPLRKRNEEGQAQARGGEGQTAAAAAVASASASVSSSLSASLPPQRVDTSSLMNDSNSTGNNISHHTRLLETSATRNNQSDEHSRLSRFVPPAAASMFTHLRRSLSPVKDRVVQEIASMTNDHLAPPRQRPTTAPSGNQQQQQPQQPIRQHHPNQPMTYRVYSAAPLLRPDGVPIDHDATIDWTSPLYLPPGASDLEKERFMGIGLGGKGRGAMDASGNSRVGGKGYIVGGREGGGRSTLRDESVPSWTAAYEPKEGVGIRAERLRAAFEQKQRETVKEFLDMRDVRRIRQAALPEHWVDKEKIRRMEREARRKEEESIKRREELTQLYKERMAKEAEEKAAKDKKRQEKMKRSLTTIKQLEKKVMKNAAD